MDWWLQTDYKQKSKIHWDSVYQSDIWNYFHQVIYGTDGAPKIIYKHCSQVLEHPYSLRNKIGEKKDQRYSLSTIKRYISISIYQRQNQEQKAEITQFLKQSIGYTSNYLYYFTNLLTIFKNNISAEAVFSQEYWKKEILFFFSLNRLFFYFIEQPTFRILIQIVYNGPSLSIIPSAVTIRCRLENLVKNRQQNIF